MGFTDKCNTICVAFLDNLFTDFTTLKELLLHKGSVKMDECYGIFCVLCYSNGWSGCYAKSVIHTKVCAVTQLNFV